MAAFSGAVSIGELNDFIAPSQACVVNLEGTKLSTLQDNDVSDHDAPVGAYMHTCYSMPTEADRLS